jgi:phosphopantothenoylcysteine decarboxylase/phosphopantothenate--cysteine ligase
MVGFAAETQNVEEYAAGKLVAKKLDMIACNDVRNSFNQLLRNFLFRCFLQLTLFHVIAFSKENCHRILIRIYQQLVEAISDALRRK